MANDLLLPLIYVSTKGNNDFITPLIKICDIYDQSNDKIESGKKLLWYIN